jgi:GNAT superfamily N-acetyltransferase
VSPSPERVFHVRNPTPADFTAMMELCGRVYPEAKPWTEAQLASHLEVFPEGQLVVEEIATGRIVGMASSLIVRWDDYDFHADWREWTDGGFFTNHDPEEGRTLYGAEVMADPALQRRGIGKRLYSARRALVRRLGLKRIRAGARLRGYHRHAAKLSPAAYVEKVVAGELRDPTLSFQLREGFEVVAVVPSYLRNDPESLGHAVVIEWLNPDLADREEAARHAEHLVVRPPGRPGGDAG